MRTSINIAQISDSHLFHDIDGLHCGVNVYHNLQRVLKELKANSLLDFIVFTGDLTQDHSETSYLRFVECVEQMQFTIPVYFISGNHDEPEILSKHLSKKPFRHETVINFPHWQVMLIESKSCTPAGKVSAQAFELISSNLDKSKCQLLFMHHHPIDVGYFIDRHNLTNADEFWFEINKYPSIKAVACGHVHRGLTLKPSSSQCDNIDMAVYTCPATSIQFDPEYHTVKPLKQGPGYRIFSLKATGQIDSSVHYLDYLDSAK